jgi:hypothetical protein
METITVSTIWPELWQFIAAMILLPSFTGMAKRFIPTRFIALLPVVLGGLANVLYGLSTGLDFWTAFLQGLGLGAAASGLRNVAVKTVSGR